MDAGSKVERKVYCVVVALRTVPQNLTAVLVRLHDQ